MPIVKMVNGVAKELTNKVKVINGQEKECTRIVKIINGQEKEIWSNSIGCMYDLGTAQTFNIPELLPNIDYTQLTADNFYTLDVNYTRGQSSDPDGGRGEGSFAIIEMDYQAPSYNPTTGQLTYRAYHWGRPGNSDYASGGYANVHCCVFVPNAKDKTSPRFMYKVRKIIDLGNISGQVDIKNRCSAWKKITTNNFVFKNWSNFYGSIGVGYFQNTISTRKSYDNTTGKGYCNIHCSYGNQEKSTHSYLIY